MCSLLLSIVCLLNCLIKAMPDEQTPKSSFQPTSKPTNNPSIVPTALPLGSSCCSNTDCYVTYKSTEDVCFMKAVYPSQEHEGFCWDGNCVPFVGHGGSCRAKTSYGESCLNAAGHADNNNCVTGLCSSSTSRCEARATSRSCLASSAKPSNDPTPKVTHNPTHKPTRMPTQKATNSPSDKATKQPSVSLCTNTTPTTYPTIDPSAAPSLYPTTSTSTTPHVITSSSSLNSLFICGSIFFACIIIAIVYVSNNKRSPKNLPYPELGLDLLEHSLSDPDDGNEMSFNIRSAMVILLTIGKYDANPENPDEELENGLSSLDCVGKDVQNLHRLFGPKYLNYTIYPSLNQDSKLYWSQDEIVQLLHERATYLEDHLDEFDGLIVVISGHGMK
eukprot:679098_1